MLTGGLIPALRHPSAWRRTYVPAQLEPGRRVTKSSAHLVPFLGIRLITCIITAYYAGSSSSALLLGDTSPVPVWWVLISLTTKNVNIVMTSSGVCVLNFSSRHLKCVFSFLLPNCSGVSNTAVAPLQVHPPFLGGILGIRVGCFFAVGKG